MSAPLGLDHPLLGRNEELELAHAAQSGDTEARNRLVEHNLRLIWNEARRYPEPQESFSVGCEIALRAIDTFRPGRRRLGPYLRVVIRRAMAKAQPETVEVVVEEQLVKGEWVPTRTERLPRETTVGLAEDHANEEAIEQRSISKAVLDLIADRIAAAEVKELDATIVTLTYGLDGHGKLSQRQIAAAVGLSRVRVRERLRRTLTRLRASFAAAGQLTPEQVLLEAE